MADIGAAAGITGPAIYRHFDGKSAVLVAMFDHVIDDLSREASEIVASGGDALATLRGLIQTQVRFVLRDRTLAQVYHNEVANLPDEDRRRLRRKQRLYIEEWVHVLAQLRPDAGDATVRALVHAAVGAIQSVLFYSSGLADDQLAALMSSVAEASLFALPARGDDPPAPDSRLGEDTPAARLPEPARGDDPRSPPIRRLGEDTPPARLPEPARGDDPPEPPDSPARRGHASGAPPLPGEASLEMTSELR